MSLTGSNNKKAILAAIAFFDLFDYPLTVLEIWQYSQEKNSLSQINKKLKEMIVAGHLEEKQNFYFLPGRVEIITTRLKRYNYTQRKLKHARRLVYLWRLIPWIKMIAVGNLIGTHNLKDKSDIDLFVITVPNRVWLTRFFTAGLAALLGLRPKPGKTKDRICLSFYISESDLCLSRFLLPPTNGRMDIYFIYWLAGLVPIYDTNQTYDKFMEINRWLKEYLPNWRRFKSVRPLIGSPNKLYGQIIDLFLGRWEKLAQKWQRKKMPTEIKKLINKDTRVVVDDKTIKLHTNDRRAKYQNKLSSTLTKIFYVSCRNKKGR